MPDHVDGLLNAACTWVFLFAHPGHELRAHHFMECVRPSVGFLTDGSGSTSESRLDDSRALLARVGARPAATLGPLTDREAYAALMAADAEPFLKQVNWLADTLLTEGVEAVLVDAAEGYNPAHDICHWIARAATARARQFGADIALFELDLIAHPDPSDDGLRLVLDDQSFRRKLDAISCYAALRGEAQAAFDRYGQDAFRVEFLRRVVDRVAPPSSWIPYYEEVGETRVRGGRYTSVLRYGSHVRPVIERFLASVQLAQYATDFRTPDQ
jgi:hypothetical protein